MWLYWYDALQVNCEVVLSLSGFIVRRIRSGVASFLLCSMPACPITRTKMEYLSTTFILSTWDKITCLRTFKEVRGRKGVVFVHTQMHLWCNVFFVCVWIFGKVLTTQFKLPFQIEWRSPIPTYQLRVICRSTTIPPRCWKCGYFSTSWHDGVEICVALVQRSLRIGLMHEMNKIAGVLCVESVTSFSNTILVSYLKACKSFLQWYFILIVWSGLESFFRLTWHS